MKKAIFLTAFVLLLCFSILLPAFAAGFPQGQWAVTSDAAAPILQLNEDGTALYDGSQYAWEDDGQFLLLKGDQEEVLHLRYQVTEKAPWIFKPMNYTRKEGTTGEGIRGVWNLDGSDMGFFEFSDKGTFLEDGLFDGTYKVDYEAGSFTLVYTKYLDDTVCYFTIDGDRMIVEYPWMLVEWKPAE